MQEFQPIPVFVKQSNIDETIRQWDERKDYFQSIVNRYKALNILAPLLENDLVNMMNTPKEFIVNKITQGTDFNLGGLKLDAEKVFELVEKPAGSIEFIEFIEASKKQNSTEKWFYRHAYFFIVVDGLVEIKPEEIEKIKTQNTVFLSSQKDKDIYDLLASICSEINNLNKLQKINNIQDTLFRELIEINSNTGLTSIKDNFLTFYNK